MAFKPLNRKQVKEKYGWGEKKLRKMMGNGLLTAAFDGRSLLYDEGSITVYLESISQKAKPPELPFETLRKEVKKDFLFLKGGATMSSKWKKSTAGRCRHQGHGFSLIEDKNGKGVHYYLDIRYPKRQTLSLRKISGRPIQGRADALNVAYEFVTKRFTELEAASSPDTTFSQLIPIAERDLIRRKRRKAKEMVKRIKAVLEPYFGKMKLREIRLYPHIEGYRDKRRAEGVKDSSIQNEIALARAMFNVAIKKELVNCRNPFEKVGVHLGLESDLRTRWMRPEEKERLWPVLEKYPPLLYMAVFLLNTGMRPLNLLLLKWKQIIWNAGTPHILIPKDQFKTKRDAIFPINGTVMEILKHLFEQNPHEPDDYVFMRREGRGRLVPINRSWYQTTWRKACAEANVDDLRFYDMKHTLGTILAANPNVNAFTIKDVFNHTQLSSTERYVKQNKSAVLEALKSVEPVLNGVN
jgi:integrase